MRIIYIQSLFVLPIVLSFISENKSSEVLNSEENYHAQIEQTDFAFNATVTSLEKSYYENQSVQLKCEYPSLYSALIDSITWIKDNSTIANTSEMNIHFTDKNSMIFDKIKKDIHAGVYMCKIHLRSNSRIITSSKFVLYVKPEIEFRSNLVNKTQILELKENDPLNLTCSVNTEDIYLLEIFFNGIPMIVSTGSKIYVHYKKILRTNQGLYACFVRMNGQVIAETTLEIKVAYQKDQRLTPIYVSIGFGGFVLGFSSIAILVAILLKRNNINIFKRNKDKNQSIELNRFENGIEVTPKNEVYYQINDYEIPKPKKAPQEDPYAKLS